MDKKNVNENFGTKKKLKLVCGSHTSAFKQG